MIPILLANGCNLQQGASIHSSREGARLPTARGQGAIGPTLPLPGLLVATGERSAAVLVASGCYLVAVCPIPAYLPLKQVRQAVGQGLDSSS